AADVLHAFPPAPPIPPPSNYATRVRQLRKLDSEPIPPLTVSKPTSWTGADTTAMGFNYASGECTGFHAPDGFGLTAEYAVQPGAYDGDFNGGWSMFGEQRYLPHLPAIASNGALQAGTAFENIHDGRIAASSGSSDVGSELQTDNRESPTLWIGSTGNTGYELSDYGGSIVFPTIQFDHALYDMELLSTRQTSQNLLCNTYMPLSISELGGGPMTVACPHNGVKKQSVMKTHDGRLVGGETTGVPSSEQLGIREWYRYGQPKFLKPAGATMWPRSAGGVSMAGAAANCIDGLDVLDDTDAPPCYTDAVPSGSPLTDAPWIEIDLGARLSVGGVLISLSQTVTDTTTQDLGLHDVRIGDVAGAPKLATTVCGHTAISQTRLKQMETSSNEMSYRTHHVDETCIGEGRYVWITLAASRTRQVYLKEVRPYAAPDISDIWSLLPDDPVEPTTTTCPYTSEAVPLVDVFDAGNLGVYTTGDNFGRTNGGGVFARPDTVLNRLTMQPGLLADSTSNVARIDHGRAGCTALRGWATLRDKDAESIGEPMWLIATGGSARSRVKLDMYGKSVPVDLALDPGADTIDLMLHRPTLDPESMNANVVSDIVDVNLELCCTASATPAGMCATMGFEHVSGTSVGWSSSEVFGSVDGIPYAVTTGTVV
ncbi:MAG: hypothetical protein ACKVI4_16805, partial [Actinomycetales bacterium]